MPPRPRTNIGTRPKPHNVTFPLNASGVEGINQNFDAIFKELRTVSGGALLNPDGVDVNPASPVAGDLIVGSNSNPAFWERFPIGAAATVLRSLGTFLEWSKVHLTSDVDQTLPIENGGTERTTFTPYAVVTGGATALGALQQVGDLGTAGQVLTSAGAAALPTWQDAAGGGETHNDGYWSPLTNGDPDNPELIFADGDAIMGWVPTP